MNTSWVLVPSGFPLRSVHGNNEQIWGREQGEVKALIPLSCQGTLLRKCSIFQVPVAASSHPHPFGPLSGNSSLLLWISLVVPLHLTHTFVNSGFIKLSWNYSNLRAICFLLGPWLTEQIANISQRTGCKNYLNIYVCLCVCIYIYASDSSV